MSCESSAIVNFRSPVLAVDSVPLHLEFKSTLEAQELREVQHVFDLVEQATRQGQHAFGFVSYEAAPAFDPSLRCSQVKSGLPLVWFGITDNISSVSRKAQTDIDLTP